MNWKVKPKIPANIRKKLSGFDDLTAQLAYNRNIETSDDLETFLNPELDSLNNTGKLNDIEKAVQIILEKVKSKEKIYIYGDYDVDGICSTSILFDFLFRSLGANVMPYIPSRFDEGYGINPTAIKKLQDEGAGLIISVDCGIRDGKILNEVLSLKTDLIITDHHQTPENEEDLEILKKTAKAVVHPLLNDYIFKDICATTVVWHLIRELAIEAKKQKLLIEDFDALKYLDLVALATVCDVMPLINQNRVIVAEGLKQMKDTQNTGLRELLMVSGISSEDLAAYHLGYVLGPRLNASGRLETALDGVRLLTSNNSEKVTELAKKLSDLNTKRQEMTKELMFESEKLLESWGSDKKLILITGQEWPEGLVGLVAGRLCEKYHRPVIVLSLKDGVAVGSCRSTSSFHITKAISLEADKLERYGGHAQAAGLTIKEENIRNFADNMLKYATEEISDEDLEKILSIEMELSEDIINKDTLEDINQFGPFGFGNKEPIISINSVKVINVKRVGNGGDHLKLTFRKDVATIDAIGFKIGEKFARIKPGDILNIAGYLDLNKFNGVESVQFKIVDIQNG